MNFNKKSSFSGVMQVSSRLSHLIRFTAFCILFPLSISTVAAAPPPTSNLPPTACDPEYMDALESRAWLEAQREITQNQNLISKPDSVLEYTCFNRFLNQMSHNFGDRLFSESGHWGGVVGITATSTDDTLDNVVRTTTLAYLSRNFEHNFLGDRLPGIDYHTTDDPIGTTPTAPAGGVTGGMPPVGTQTGSADTTARGATEHVNGAQTYPVTGIAYDCDRMAKVWELARCLNFMQRPDKDSFFDFPWYTTHDPRDLPQGFASCQSPTAATGNNNAITEAMQSAFNGDAAEVNLYTLEQDNDPFADATRYNKDPIVSHLNLISPIGQNNTNTCGGSIQTGVTVVRDTQSYPEVICTNPGCAQPVGGGNCTPQ